MTPHFCNILKTYGSRKILLIRCFQYKCDICIKNNCICSVQKFQMEHFLTIAQRKWICFNYCYNWKKILSSYLHSTAKKTAALHNGSELCPDPAILFCTQNSCSSCAQLPVGFCCIWKREDQLTFVNGKSFWDLSLVLLCVFVHRHCSPSNGKLYTLFIYGYFGIFMGWFGYLPPGLAMKWSWNVPGLASTIQAEMDCADKAYVHKSQCM